MKYYYVIFGSSSEFMRASYRDINDYEGAEYYFKNLATDNAIINVMFRVHNSKKINRVIDLPHKQIWFGALTPEISTCLPICFLFFAGGTRFSAIKDGYVEYLREKYPGCKTVIFYQDLVSLPRGINIDTIKKHFDMVLSFDHDDCKKYNLHYYPLVYSSSESHGISVVNDVFFVGKAKDRLKDIIYTYEILRDKGLKCDFNIVGVSPEHQQYKNEINYCDPMPYSENIRHIKSAKAILEIMQQNGKGFTLRTCEAIANDRMLITNNSEVRNAPFYNEQRVITFDCPENINQNQIKLAQIPVDYHYKEVLSPINLLKHLDNML